MNGAQILEKNHFPVGQNRVTTRAMQTALEAETSRRRARLLLLLMAIALAAATIAPMAVLAG
jgi:hypothetical protein